MQKIHRKPLDIFENYFENKLQSSASFLYVAADITTVVIFITMRMRVNRKKGFWFLCFYGALKIEKVKAISGNEANLQSTGFISNLRIRAACER